MKKKHNPFRPSPPLVIPFAVAADEFMTLQQQYGIANATTMHRKRAVASFLLFAGAGLPCAAVNRKLMESYTLHLKTALRLSPATVNRYIRAISPIIKYGVSRGYIPEDFTMPLL